MLIFQKEHDFRLPRNFNGTIPANSNKYLCSSYNTMPWILLKIIPSDEVLFLRKSKAELVLTNLKTFDTFAFHNYQK